MSTTTAPASSVNGAATVSTPGNASAPTSASGRAQLKTNTGSKMVDAARKQAGSPIDGTQKKQPAQKAWTQGTNPITQRHANSNASNGVINSPKSTPTQNNSAPSRETQSPSRHMNDRLLFLLANFMGLASQITLKNGEQYTGVFSGMSQETSEQRYVFKMVKRIQSANNEVNGTSEDSQEYVGVGENYVMNFDIADVADLHVENVQLDKTQAKSQNGLSSGFRTDAEISGNLSIRERNLQRWEPSADTAVDLSLGSAQSGWDQFETNERLYGVKSSYNEDLYTTTIDTSSPLYKERAARAERIAREIEKENAMNAHVAEERGQVLPDDSGVDEEEKYSGVRRDLPQQSAAQTNKYTPPARRAPTGQPTVSGAPFDPAIISSQLARPGSTVSRSTATPDSTITEKQQPTVPPKAEEPQKTETPAATASAPVEPAKSTAATDSKPTPVKGTAETTQKPSNALKPSANNVPATLAPRKVGRPDNATANVEHDLLDAFKQFNATEKLRIQERQRNLQRQDKAVKLNDLKKFSQNFKLQTPVPQDLVPILAKDETKQKEIVEKALRNVQELKTTHTKPAPATSAEPKVARPAANFTSASPQADRQANQRQRQGQNNYATSSLRGDRAPQNQNIHQQMPPRPAGTGLLSQRLSITSQQHKAGASQATIPHPLPIQDTRMPPAGPAGSSSGGQTPTSSVSTRFNVKAMEFRPNPAANTFTPTGNPSTGSSPRVDSAVARPEPRKKEPKPFFDSAKPSPVSDSPAFDNAFNPLKRMKAEVQKDEHKSKEFAFNGGIPQAYRTPPTWDVPEANREKSYVDMFAPTPLPVHSISPPQAGMVNGPMPHQHQLPPHLQQNGPHIPQGHTPHHTPRHPAAQPHHHGPNGPHHFDSHPMQFSASTSSVHPSPRPMAPFMYQQGQPVPVYQQPMPAYGMSPGMHPAALRQQPGGQFINVPGPQMSGHMMATQPSNGPYMNMQMNPQQMMYSPAPGQIYPHQAGQLPPPPGPNGYPSPRPPVAHMMSHQGSQQGQQPQGIVYVPGNQMPMFAQMPQGPMTPMRVPYPQPHQPHFGSSPHQPHSYPHQPHRGTPSASYAQPMMPTHTMPPQGPPPTGPSHVPGEGEEVK